MIDEFNFKFRTIKYTKEKDGVILPHVTKQLFCHPAAPVNFVREETDDITETIDGED